MLVDKPVDKYGGSWGMTLEERVKSGQNLDIVEIERIPLEEVFMRMAEELAKRSTCARNQVLSLIHI